MVQCKLYTKNGLDFGHAELIHDYLIDQSPDYVWPDNFQVHENAQAVQATVDGKDSEFFAKLEMAENYGWIENTAIIDRITADIERRRLHCEETQNYGFYFRTGRAYLKNLERYAENHKVPWQKRLAELRARAGEEFPIFGEIERLISVQMYTVAQDYMDQYEKEGRREIPESASLVDESDILMKYINRYADNYRTARNSETGKLQDYYNRQHRNEENNLVKTGRAMLEAWPKSMGNPDTMRNKVKSLFTYMGLPVKDVDFVSGAHFYMSFHEQEITADYPHPIGAYGSDMLSNGLNVFLSFGAKDSTTMNTAIRQMITSSVVGASVIVVDAPLSLADKRKLAQTIKQDNQMRAPYLILDRVTILFLANQPQVERWNIFLKCSLPFHYYNPFTESSTVAIFPEMFIGRRDELEQVISTGGANIICGGRQLGKTALLHRARTLEDSRENGKWSVYVEIKPCDAISAATRIFEKLQDEGFLAEDDRQVTWDELARLITKRINSGTPVVKKFLLLMDEADNFLADCLNSGNCQPVDSLKRVQTDTGNKFKFGLAGLHNVMRFHTNASDSNSSIPHLSTITIKPLPFKEASELLEKPLSYLGFRMKRENIPLIVQILSSTNYYPGLIQFYASRLVRSVCQNNYGDVGEKPPYWLQEAQILMLLKDQELSYTQFKRLWNYITTRSTKERCYYRYKNGERVKHTVKPQLGEKALHNGKVVYSLDFEVTPHLLRHTYITNLIYASVDPKTVQYLAGHENSKITMVIYAKVKYNTPDELINAVGGAFDIWDEAMSDEE